MIEAVDEPEKVWTQPRIYHFVPIYKRDTLPIRNYPVNALLQSPTDWLTQIITISAKTHIGRSTVCYTPTAKDKGKRCTALSAGGCSA